VPYEPFPCHVVTDQGDDFVQITGPRIENVLVRLSADQADEIAAYLKNHAANLRLNARRSAPPAQERDHACCGRPRACEAPTLWSPACEAAGREAVAVMTERQSPSPAQTSPTAPADEPLVNGEQTT
jgi:hypothetical protein